VREATAAEGPEYFCKMWTTGNPSPATGRAEFAMVEAHVPSISSVHGDAAADEALLSVPRSMLHGESLEMHLCLRIEKAAK
jgi:E3 ubiquitin-protein ligase SIAH1